MVEEIRQPIQRIPWADPAGLESRNRWICWEVVWYLGKSNNRLAEDAVQARICGVVAGATTKWKRLVNHLLFRRG